MTEFKCDTTSHGNMKFNKICIILAFVTIVLNFGNNAYLGYKFYSILSNPENTDIFALAKWVDDFNLFISIPLMLITSVFPIYWAIQNPKKKWIWIVAIASILISMQGLLAIALLSYMYFSNMRREFLQWRAEQNA